MIENTYADKNKHHKIAIYFLIDENPVGSVREIPVDKYSGYVKEPKWTYIDTFIDKIQNGKREQTAFVDMIDRCRHGEIDLIITPNIYHFASSVEEGIKIIEELLSLENPVGVFFELEAAYTLAEEGYKRYSFLSLMFKDELKPYNIKGVIQNG